MQFLDVVTMKDPNQKTNFYRNTLIDALPFIPKVHLLVIYYLIFIVRQILVHSELKLLKKCTSTLPAYRKVFQLIGTSTLPSSYNLISFRRSLKKHFSKQSWIDRATPMISIHGPYSKTMSRLTSSKTIITCRATIKKRFFIIINKITYVYCVFNIFSFIEIS